MNMLIAGASQLLLRDNWQKQLNVAARDTGNAMDAGEMVDFNAWIDIPALRAYRLSVGQCTREIVKTLQPGEFKCKVDPVRLQQVLAEEAVLASQQWLIDY